MTDEQGPRAEPGPASGSQRDPSEDEAARQFREQQAIASAMMIGEEMRRESQAQLRFYAQRLGVFVFLLAVLGIIVLYAYARLKGDFNPLLGMLILGFTAAVGATVSYWAHVESRHASED